MVGGLLRYGAARSRAARGLDDLCEIRLVGLGMGSRGRDWFRRR